MSLEPKIEDRGSRIEEDASGMSSLVCPSSLDPQSSALRAWFYLVWLCTQRLAQLRQMVWIALALLVLIATIVGLTTLAGRAGMSQWHWDWTGPARPLAGSAAREALRGSNRLPPLHTVRMTYEETATGMELLPRILPQSPFAAALQDVIAGACQLILTRSKFYLFSNWLVFSIFVGFLLPIWSLSFATEALGGERETRSLVWLLTRPLSRPSIYLAKFVALLPWCLGFNVGGFALLCLLAGWPGQLAFRLYWPAVLGGTLAFSALFHLMGAYFRRPAVIALVYSFFLETILGSMPGYMKRISIGFYTRCLMFDAAQGYGVQAEKPSIYLPVDGLTAWCVLLSLTLVLLAVGMLIFSRLEYQDQS